MAGNYPLIKNFFPTPNSNRIILFKKAFDFNGLEGMAERCHLFFLINSITYVIFKGLKNNLLDKAFLI